ncbi:MAG: DUF427 domain-containing protein [bacterium]
MTKAIWQGKVLAESDRCEMVEGNHYFPPESIHNEYLTESKTQTECPWKGTAHYYHIQVEDDVNVDAAWYYPEPKKAAKNIKGYVAFWRGVEIED